MTSERAIFMAITEKDKELRGIIESNLDGMYSYKAYDAMQMLSVCDENYEYIKALYNAQRYKVSFAYRLRDAYLNEKAEDLFALFSASDEAIVRSIAVNIAKTHSIDLNGFFAEIDRKSKKLLENTEGKMAFLAKYAEKYRVDVSDDGLAAVIYNPAGKEAISVVYEIDEYTVCFSLQHIHVQYPKDAEEWIDDVMSETLLPIGFYKDGKIVMGSHIKSSALRKLSYEKLREKFRFFDGGELCDGADSFKVRSWSGEKDLDAEFVYIDGRVMIKAVN